MKNIVSCFGVGFLFAMGLGISGMTQPQKVQGFLNIFGEWDPSLLFVMVGAIMLHSVLYHLIRKRKSPILATEWNVPTKKDITPSLVLGAALFGIGWGLAGFCPGPALVSLSSFKSGPYVFVVSMIIGMYLFRLLDKKFKFRR